MQTGYYNAIGGMVTQFNELDTLSNNLANVNTAGFKQDKNIVSNFSKIFQSKRDELELYNNTVEASKFYNRTMTKVPQVSEVYTDHALGALKATDNPLDLGIGRQDLFFVVQTPSGQQLTRNGAFSLDDQGNLVTKSGHAVLDTALQPIGLAQEGGGSAEVSFDKDGSIYVDGVLRTKLYIAQPLNVKELLKAGNGNFELDGTTMTPQASSGAINQGFLEQSNVNPVYSMTQLIATNRMLEMSQKVASSQMDDMNNEAINKLAVNK